MNALIDLRTRNTHMAPHERPQKVTHPTLDRELAATLVWAKSFEMAAQEAVALTTLSDTITEFLGELANERVRTARALHEEGWSYTEIGDLLGVSRARAAQLVLR